MALLPELKMAPEPVALGLHDGQVRLGYLGSGLFLRHSAEAVVGGGYRPLFKTQELGIHLDPVASVFWQTGVRVLALQPPVGIDRVVGCLFGMDVFGPDGFSLIQRSSRT